MARSTAWRPCTVLVIVGIVGSSQVKNKAAGINVDLGGLGMLVFAALMLPWAFSRPVEPEPAT
jgi:hypothetical protein